MTSKPLDSITLDDLQLLLENRISEGKTIEYKQVLPGGTSEEKIKFLRAVSSLANSAGGDLLYGVEAQDGIPEALPGLQERNEDDIKLRLESLLRDGVEPRIPTVQFRFVPVNGDRVILIIRVGKSWNGPHRVRLAGHGHFYGRNSSGAYQLDVGELRTAFTLSADIAERIRAFRADRLMKIEAGQTPVPIVTAATMVFHLVPLVSFSSSPPIRISFGSTERQVFYPLGRSGWSTNVNLDGYVIFTDRSGDSAAYTQVFRSGMVESVAVFEPHEGYPPSLPTGWIEEQLIQALPRFIQALISKDLEPPYFLFLSFLKARGYQLATAERYLSRSDILTDRDSLILPEVEIEQVGFDSAAVLRPLFDMLWNAFGYENCQNYDDHGVYIKR
ncbi:MAG: ATP-binding protein [Nitrososphaera sp.]|nr:ATP-binding protein [Nitrososphaera sp.]